MTNLETARAAWRTLEPYHAMIYFAPEARTAYQEIGLKGYWMGYFASRSAPLGAVPAAIVTATFYNFHPSMVARAIPDAWQRARPEQVTVARLQAADAALRHLLGDQVSSAEIAEAAVLARRATEACSIIGRILFAAYTTLPWPQEPHLVLWHAATLLREFRTDGHVAALLTEGIDGLEAHITLVGTGITPRETIQPNRGWSDSEWEEAEQRLRKRGVIDETGRLTPQGQALRQAVEDKTDQLALAPWQRLGEQDTSRLLELVRPLSIRIIDQQGITMPNPMGLPRP